MSRLPTSLRLVLVVLLPVLGGCHGTRVSSATSNGALTDVWGRASDAHYLRVRGIGVPRRHGDHEARRASSREAALAQARYELLAVIKGVKVEGGYTVGDLIERDGNVRAEADLVVAGAEEIRTEWLKDDSCVVTLELARDRIDDVVRKTSALDPIAPKRRVAVRIRTDAAGNKKMDVSGDADTLKEIAKFEGGINLPDFTPATAISLVFPGGGQIYYGNDLQNEGLSNTGLLYMFGTAALVGVGGATMTAHGTQVGPASLAFFVLAGLVHLTGAWNASGDVAAVKGGDVGVDMDDDGRRGTMSVKLYRKF